MALIYSKSIKNTHCNKMDGVWLFSAIFADMQAKTSKNHDSFFAMVYEVAKLIPKGRVTSYGAIAKYLGTGRSSRMVGWAMNGAHNMPDVPAHRVVNRNGLLTGKHHFGSPTRMQELLEAEGIVVKKDQVQNFKKIYWDPVTELAL